MGRSFDSHPLVEGYGTSCRGAPEFRYCRHNELICLMPERACAPALPRDRCLSYELVSKLSTDNI